MRGSRCRRKEQTPGSSAAPWESTASRGEKRASSLPMCDTQSSEKAAAQNSPVDTSQKAAAPDTASRYTAQT